MRWLVDLAPVVMISGSICGLASFGWISVQTVQGYLRTRRSKRSIAAAEAAREVFNADWREVGIREALKREAERLNQLPLEQLVSLKRVGFPGLRSLGKARRAELESWMARRGR